MIGGIVKEKCGALKVEPRIAIDVPTRLSLSIEATESDFRSAVLPIEGWEVLTISKLENGISVEMKPTESPPPRNPFAEIDEIKAKIADYNTLKARVETLEKK